MLGRGISRNQGLKVFKEMSDALYKEGAAKLKVLLEDWQKRHKEQFEIKLEGWEGEIRKSVRNIIREEYEQFKKNENN